MHMNRRLCLALASSLIAMLAGCGGGGAGGNDASQTNSIGPTARILSANAASGAPSLPLPNVQFLSLTKVRETRISRTEYDYEFSVQVSNSGAAAAGVKLVLMSAPTGTTVMKGEALLGDVSEGGQKSSSNVIVLRQDRTKPFSPSDLRWNVLMVASLNPTGVDKDGNGIRDDIDYRIGVIAAGKPAVDAALKSFARSLQAIANAADTIDSSSARNLVLDELKTGLCAHKAVGDASSKANRDELFWSTYDTAPRRAKRQQVLDTAGTFVLPEEEPTCA